MTRQNNKWFDYSGASPILLPLDLASKWRGFYLPAAETDGLPDLVVGDQAFVISDEFDFQDPKTDYDHLCGFLNPAPSHHLFPVGDDTLVCFTAGHDNWTWWEQEKMAVGGHYLPTAGEIETCQWQDPIEWQLRGPDCYLMNSCSHGSDTKDDERLIARLAEGIYIIDFAEPKTDTWVSLYRFRPKK